MATRDAQDPNNAPGDWWSQNAPAGNWWEGPRPSYVPATAPWPPPLPPGASYGPNPGQIIYAPGTQPTNPDQPQPGADTPVTVDQPTYYPPPAATTTSSGRGDELSTTPIVTPGLPTTGFGAAPPTYASDPNAPTFEPLPTYVAPTWTGGDYVAPTVQDLENSPGYQARMDAVLKTRNRSAAAQGTVLNGGTLVALDRDAQNFASNEYQTLNANTLDAYKQRYAQFTDAAGRDLASRTVNANANQSTYANRTSAYTAGNARTLSDYLTNVTSKRNAELDYWNRLQDLNQTGANLAGGSR